MTIELDSVFESFAAALLCLAVGFHLLQHAWRARHALNVKSRHPSHPGYFSSDRPASRSTFNQSHATSEALITLRQGEGQEPPIKTIQERVTAAISMALVVDASLVVPSASLSDDLHADSLNLVEMVMILEEDFEITISDEEAETIRTVQHAIDHVVLALNSKHSRAP